MMTDCLHYTVYMYIHVGLHDAIKLVIDGIELEGEGVDGKNVAKGPMCKCGPQQP